MSALRPPLPGGEPALSAARADGQTEAHAVRPLSVAAPLGLWRRKPGASKRTSPRTRALAGWAMVLIGAAFWAAIGFMLV